MNANQDQTNSERVANMPLNRALTYYSSEPEEQVAYVAMQKSAFKVAELLMEKKPGAYADIDGYCWWVSPWGSMKEIMCSPEDDLAGDTEINVFLASGFEGIDAEDLDNVRKGLEQWLKAPVFNFSNQDTMNQKFLREYGKKVENTEEATGMPLNRELQKFSSYPEEQSAFEAMQKSAFKVADILMSQAPGAYAQIEDGFLWVSPVFSVREVFISDENNFKGDAEIEVRRVSDIDGLSESQLIELTAQLDEWIESPVVRFADQSDMDRKVSEIYEANENHPSAN